MSKYEELSKLKELLDSGVLSQEEFEAKKKNILSGADNTAPKKSKKNICYDTCSLGNFSHWRLFLLSKF